MRRLLSTLPLLLAACSTPATAPDGSAPTTPASAATSGTLAPPPSITAAVSASATTAADPSGAPSADPAPTASAAASASPTASAAAAPEEPIPSVKVANIGMHIGGGPHDAVTKAPIKTSVEPHFDALRRCWKHVDDPKKGGDFGVDLLIDKAGGKAKLSHARTSIKGAGFKECLVAAFEAIDFKKPRGGTTMVSYSVRFTP